LRRKLREWYVIEKAAMILYALGLVGGIVFAVQGEWLRVAVTALVVASLWFVAFVRAVCSEPPDQDRANYERQIASRSRAQRIARERERYPEMQRRRNHR
jgi:uncharacterized membrane protein